MNELHLFAGAGGGIYGGQLLGHTTVCAVEIESYCRQVMHQRQRDGIFPRFPIWDDVTTFDGRPWKGSVDIVAGGFPCQDISAAGKGAGLAGKRSGLWAEFARIIGEIQPQFAFIENSPLLRTRGLVTVLQDLAQMGYDARWCVLGAWHAGAPHKRDRMWILAYPRSQGPQRKLHKGSACKEGWETQAGRAAASCGRAEREVWRKDKASGAVKDLADANQSGSRQNIKPTKLRANWSEQSPQDCRTPGQAERQEGCSWWHQDPAEMADAEHQRRERCKSSARRREALFKDGSFTGRNSENELHRSEESRPTKPLLGRVAHGVANRRKRLAAIGNGQVPQCAAMAFNILSKGLI